MATTTEGLEVQRTPDVRILKWIGWVDRASLVVSALVAGATFAGWLVPGIGARLPAGWSLMMPTTALALLLCTAALVITGRTRRWLGVGHARVLAALAMAIAAASVYEHFGGRSLGVGALLAAADSVATPRNMAIQTAVFLLLLGASLMIAPTRQGTPGRILDFLIGTIVVFGMVLVAGYVFDVPGVYGQSALIRTSAQTLLCLALLGLVQTGRRAPHGYFSVLVSTGIGSRFARIALPFSQFLAFLAIAVGEGLYREGVMSLSYAAALTATSMATILFFLVLVLAHKINRLGRDLSAMSVTDELTRLNNRRGFYLLGEHAMWEARRAGAELGVIFLDVDGLKQVNDSLGHDAGSALLVDVATLLQESFRRSDIIGRLGGDEFAVITRGSVAELAAVVERLQEDAERTNRSGDKPYLIRFSAGVARLDLGQNESFAQLVERADAAMYQQKRRHHEAEARAQAATTQSPSASHP